VRCGRLCAQARNDARVAVAGSLDMFSNRFLQAPVDTAAQGPRRGGPRSACRQAGSQAATAFVLKVLDGHGQQPAVKTSLGCWRRAALCCRRRCSRRARRVRRSSSAMPACGAVR
jgi:hypothetical protein